MLEAEGADQNILQALRQRVCDLEEIVKSKNETIATKNEMLTTYRRLSAELVLKEEKAVDKAAKDIPQVSGQ